jgi:hypothetical protein
MAQPICDFDVERRALHNPGNLRLHPAGGVITTGGLAR